jgi:hypothetical protein
MAAQVISAAPGARLDVRHLIVEGDLAAAHWTMTWTPPKSPAARLARAHHSTCAENGGERRDQIVVRMTHRHFAIFRTRVKP